MKSSTDGGIEEEDVVLGEGNKMDDDDDFFMNERPTYASQTKVRCRGSQALEERVTTPLHVEKRELSCDGDREVKRNERDIPEQKATNVPRTCTKKTTMQRKVSDTNTKIVRFRSKK